MKTLSRLFIGLMIASVVLTSCTKDDDEATPSNSNGLQIEASDFVDQAQSFNITVNGGTPPYEVKYTPINTTADNDLIIIREETYINSDTDIDYFYEFDRESDLANNPGTYEFIVTDSDGNTATKTIVNRGLIIEYDPTNRIWYQGSKVSWYPGDVGAYNYEGYSFGVTIGAEGLGNNTHHRLIISAPDGTTLADGITDFPSSLIGSMLDGQLQIQFWTVSNGESDIIFSSSSVSNQSGSMTIQLISDDSNEYGIEYIKIVFNGVKLEGFDSETLQNVEFELTGVVAIRYYEGE